MKQIRRPNGSDRITEDNHVRCTFGLHKPPKPFVTHVAKGYHNALLGAHQYLMCEECSQSDYLLRNLRNEYNIVEIERIGMVKKK